MAAVGNLGMAFNNNKSHRLLLCHNMARIIDRELTSSTKTHDKNLSIEKYQNSIGLSTSQVSAPHTSIITITKQIMPKTDDQPSPHIITAPSVSSLAVQKTTPSFASTHNQSKHP